MVSTMFQEDFPISIHTLRVEGDNDLYIHQKGLS